MLRLRSSLLSLAFCCALSGTLTGQPGTFIPHYFPHDPVYVAEFFERYVTTAVRASGAFHIPASIILGTAALESGYGLADSKIIQECNNLFNMKTVARGDTSCCAMVPEIVNGTDTVISEAYFRTFFSPEESIWGYCEFISTSDTFRHLLCIPRWDYREWADGLSRSGYASDPDYDEKLTDIIERYRLWRFDPVPCPHLYPEIEQLCEFHGSGTEEPGQ